MFINEITSTYQNIEQLFGFKTFSPGEEITTEKFDLLIEYIEKNCSEIVEEIKKTRTFLYRGSRNEFNVSMAYLGTTPNKRNPRDSELILQNMYDTYAKSLGMEALRSNSIFVVASKAVTRPYGDWRFIFPFNGFKFTWDKLHCDLLLRHNAIGSLGRGKFLDDAKQYFKESTDIEERQIFATIIKHNTIQEIDKCRLNEFYNKKIHSNSSYSSHPFIEKWYYNDFYENYTPDLDIFEKRFNLNNTDLSEAMYVRHEILIHGTYLSVHQNFEKDFREYFIK